MDPTYRFLTADDAAAFSHLRMRALATHPEAFHSSPEDWAEVAPDAVVARILDNPTAGAFDGKALVGIASLALTARHQAKRRHRAEIWNVYVAPEARGGGVARRLMQMLIDDARRRGLEGLVLTVATSNAGAIGLYRSLGFAVIGTEPGALRLPGGGASDDHMMLKIL
jgi:ribosomal protein S18 acetylase RimI-like enzyme